MTEGIAEPTAARVGPCIRARLANFLQAKCAEAGEPTSGLPRRTCY